MHVIDSHTEGEPTRVIVSGGPDLGEGTLCERLVRFQENADQFRQFAINEPRGWDAVVGALLCEPDDATCDAAVIFFNNTGYLGMCGHGTIGVAVTLHYLDRVGLGKIRIQTPVGVVTAELTGPNNVTIENVPSYRYRRDVTVEVDGIGSFAGDIAWGGNWFFLVHGSPVPLLPENIDELLRITRRIKSELTKQGITGVDGALIDHIEISSDVESEDVDCQNFVLCPGGVYDRSPCGTGTSAKMACLAADGVLDSQQKWVQQSVTGGRFTASYRQCDPSNEFDSVIASVSGGAFICSNAKLVVQVGDPYNFGMERRDGN